MIALIVIFTILSNRFLTADNIFNILRQVSIENAAEADRVFSMLMGDDVPPRREFIERHATYANIDA